MKYIELYNEFLNENEYIELIKNYHNFKYDLTNSYYNIIDYLKDNNLNTFLLPFTKFYIILYSEYIIKNNSIDKNNITIDILNRRSGLLYQGLNYFRVFINYLIETKLDIIYVSDLFKKAINEVQNNRDNSNFLPIIKFGESIIRKYLVTKIKQSLNNEFIKNINNNLIDLVIRKIEYNFAMDYFDDVNTFSSYSFDNNLFGGRLYIIKDFDYKNEFILTSGFKKLKGEVINKILYINRKDFFDYIYHIIKLNLLNKDYITSILNSESINYVSIFDNNRTLIINFQDKKSHDTLCNVARWCTTTDTAKYNQYSNEFTKKYIILNLNKDLDKIANYYDESTGFPKNVMMFSLVIGLKDKKIISFVDAMDNSCKNYEAIKFLINYLNKYDFQFFDGELNKYFAFE